MSATPRRSTIVCGFRSTLRTTGRPFGSSGNSICPIAARGRPRTYSRSRSRRVLIRARLGSSYLSARHCTVWKTRLRSALFRVCRTSTAHLQCYLCRKYRILDDCARLREMIEMFPQDRHFIPSVLFILWGEAEAEALPGDLLRMVSSFHTLHFFDHAHTK
jgi:hypothetical protein